MTKLKTSRGLIKYLFFSFITCGIYGFFFIHNMAKDLNVACAEDNRKTAGLLKYILLSIVTLGIYSIIWMWRSANRIAAYGERNNVLTTTTGGSWFMWNLFGVLLCGLGPFYALYNYLYSMNLICRDFNSREAAKAEDDAQVARIANAVVQALAPMIAANTAVEETPAEEAPVEEVPAEEAPAEEAPVEEAPAEEAPAEEAPAEEAPAEETTEA